eukprot:5415072-Alexandrium_andersonii.AAC.1
MACWGGTTRSQSPVNLGPTWPLWTLPASTTSRSMGHEMRGPRRGASTNGWASEMLRPSPRPCGRRSP